MKYACEYCGSETDSVSELFACERQCEAEDRNTRGWFARKDVHRKD